MYNNIHLLIYTNHKYNHIYIYIFTVYVCDIANQYGKVGKSIHFNIH